MKLFKYKINSSVIIANVMAVIAVLADMSSNGAIVGSLAEVIMHFLDQPEAFKPYLTDKIYQSLLTFLPIVTIILRNTNVRYRPPVEKVE